MNSAVQAFAGAIRQVLRLILFPDRWTRGIPL
jgi:hypothetical protein